MREIYSQLIAIRIAEGVGDISNKLNWITNTTEIFGYVDQSATRKIVKGAMGLMIWGPKEKKLRMIKSELHFKGKPYFIAYVR